MKKKAFLTVLMGILVFGIGFPGYAWFVGNYSSGCFSTPEGIRMAGADTMSIKELVIRGAGCFLRGKAYVSRFAEKVELSELQGIDFYHMNQLLWRALTSMKSAHYYYQTLKKKADETPYNPQAIQELAIFDYDTFGEKNNLVKDIYADVKSCLIKGDVRGFYGHLLIYTDNIIDLLRTLKGNIEIGIFPDIENIWTLNQKCSKMLLFGQYASRVFKAIQDN
jgi:hypothetical protein